MSEQSAYKELTSRFTQLYRYQHVAAMGAWDKLVIMPPKGHEARAAALAQLDVLIHRTQTDQELPRLLEAAEQENLTDMERCSVREMWRCWRRANLLPESLVEAMTLAGARCEHGWRTQRYTNDWVGFLENFREVVRLSREEAQLLAVESGSSRYDALMDKYEPGMKGVEIERLFNDIKCWLPELIANARDKQASEAVMLPTGLFPIAQQRALGVEVMALIGFDFDAGRLDVSMHPFCGGVAEDVRLTTRYREDNFMQSLMGIIHETGHACYEQNLPREWVALPVGQARSMGIHESQSLSFEMQLARHPGFLAYIAPLLRQYLGNNAAFEPDNLARLYTRVSPGSIRVDADELCYPAHIVLRFEIERDLINGDVEAEDIPALWDEKMMAYLGIDTRGDYQDGCLQDIHWTDGSFGYFPSYTLGAMYAAQYFAYLRKNNPALDSQIARGELTPIFEWLKEAIWTQGSRWETAELIYRATGEPLNPEYFQAHLAARYLG